MANKLLDVAKQTRYSPDAFAFVERGLSYTVNHIHGQLDEAPDDADEQQMQSRHVSGVQLCYGLRDFAVDQYGMLARTVLKRWGITSCEDFGRIVFAMVESNMMRKTDDDTLDDFAGVFEFSEAFETPLVIDNPA